MTRSSRTRTTNPNPSRGPTDDRADPSRPCADRFTATATGGSTLQDRVLDLLAKSRAVLADVAVECRAGDHGNFVVHLRGSVPTYHMKQLAQETVRRVDGVCRIVNELTVEPPDSPEEPRS